MKRLGFVLPLLLSGRLRDRNAAAAAVRYVASGGPARGIDMAMDSRDVAQEFKGSGLHFVARYYRSPLSRLPPLSADEARMVSSNGMKLVAVWQYQSNRPEHFSYERGYADAISAYQQARAVGQPNGTAIYFAVDYNAPDRDIAGAVQQYFRGARDGLAAAGGGSPPYRIGVYGSGAVCLYLKRTQLAEYTWLSASTAWYGSSAYGEWNIKQGRTDDTAVVRPRHQRDPGRLRRLHGFQALLVAVASTPPRPREDDGAASGTMERGLAYDRNNVFARILRGELPCAKVYEDEHVLAFRDINPQAPTHIVIIPKGEYVSVDDFSANASEAELAAFMRAIGQVAQQEGVVAGGYRILANHGAAAHQEVPHFHLHLFGGRDLGPMLRRAG